MQEQFGDIYFLLTLPVLFQKQDKMNHAVYGVPDIGRLNLLLCNVWMLYVLELPLTTSSGRPSMRWISPNGSYWYSLYRGQ